MKTSNMKNRVVEIMISFLTSVFLVFTALSYLIDFGYARQTKIFDLFLIIFSIVGSLLLTKGLNFVSNKIKKVLINKSYKTEKIRTYVLYSLLPLSIGGIISIALIFVYKHLLTLAFQAERYVEYADYVMLIPEIHWNAIFTISILAAISSFIILTALLLKNKCKFKDSVLISFRTVLLLGGLSLLTTFGIFVLSFLIFTTINLSGAAPFGP